MIKETIAQWQKNKIEEFNNHPAMKFANSAIVLQAVRSGTKGYEGEENLTEFFEKALSTQLEEIRGIIKKERETWAKESIGDTALRSLEVALNNKYPDTGDPCQEYIRNGKCEHQPASLTLLKEE